MTKHDWQDSALVIGVLLIGVAVAFVVVRLTR